jgi:alpha-galactosidase
LVRAHPDLPLDSCASGGRRNDLEGMRRAVSRTRSDYLIEPIGEQCHTYGIALWLPYYGTGFMDTVTAADRRKDFGNLWNILSDASSMKPLVRGETIPVMRKDRYGAVAYGLDDRYPFRSSMCPSMTWCLDVRKTDVHYELLRQLARQWRQLSPYMLADYYPLSAYSTGTDVWMAWQFNRPESGDGMVQAFRRHESPYETATYSLHGLDEAASYELTDVDTSEVRRLTGRELLQQGFPVRIAQKPGAVIITYKKVSG